MAGAAPDGCATRSSSAYARTSRQARSCATCPMRRRHAARSRRRRRKPDLHAPAVRREERKAAMSVAKPHATTVHARAPGHASEVAGIAVTHPDRELWPDISKRDLAEYWLAVADRALPGIAHRPLALVRCPDGIAGEHFFQKHAGKGFPPQIRGGEADGAPYLAIDDTSRPGCRRPVRRRSNCTPGGPPKPIPCTPIAWCSTSIPARAWRSPRWSRPPSEVRERLKRHRARAGSAAPPAARGCMSWRRWCPRADWDVARELVPRLRTADGGGRAGPLRRLGAERAAARAYSGRLAAQRVGRHGRRLVLAARPPWAPAWRHHSRGAR